MEKGQFKEMSVPVKWSIKTGKLTYMLLVQLSHYQRRSGNEQLAVNVCNLFLNIKNSFWYCELGTLVSEPLSKAFFLPLVAHLNTFTAIVDLSQLNNSCLKSPASTLVDLNFNRARSALSA